MLAHLHALAKRYPNVPAALAELANLNAILTLPKPTVHVVSDVHGEYVKLRQVINNASGSLRPLVDRLYAGSLEPEERNDLLALFYYPRETWLAQTRGKSEHRAPREAVVVRAARGHGDPGSRTPLHAPARRQDHFGSVRRDVPRADVLERAVALAGVRHQAARAVPQARSRSRSRPHDRAHRPQPRDRRARRRG